MPVSANRLHLKSMLVQSRGERWGRGVGKQIQVWGKELWNQTELCHS